MLNTRFGLGLIFLTCILVCSIGRRAVVSTQQAYEWHYRGSLLYSEGRYKQARELLQNAYHAQPNNYNFGVAYGLCLGRLGDSGQAQGVFANSRRGILPRDPERSQKLALNTFFSGMSYLYSLHYGQAYVQLRSAVLSQKTLNQPKLLSIFYNALAYATLLNQSNNGHHREDMPSHYHIHRRDMERAADYYAQSLLANPENELSLDNYRELADTLQLLDELPPGLGAILDTMKAAPTFIQMHQTIIRDLHLGEFDELVFLIDISGSMVMEKVVCYGEDRFTAMKELCMRILPEIKPQVQLGIGTIGGNCGTVPSHWNKTGSISRVDIHDKLRFLIPDGTTPLLSMLVKSPELFSKVDSTRKCIFLISDGANTCRESGWDICELAGMLKQKKIAVNVLTFLENSYDNTSAFGEYLCLSEITRGHIIYLDNYRCRLEPLALDLVKTCQFKFPDLQKSTCWGAHIKNLWMVDKPTF
jgi:tetratricopeptide (TPR) repeat protein